MCDTLQHVGFPMHASSFHSNKVLCVRTLHLFHGNLAGKQVCQVELDTISFTSSHDHAHIQGQWDNKYMLHIWLQYGYT
jgi:hypothetical protein